MAPFHAQMASRFRGREAPSERYFVIATQFLRPAFSIKHTTMSPDSFIDHTTMSSAFIIEHTTTPLAFFIEHTPVFSLKIQPCRLLHSLNTRQCRLLFYSLSTTMSSASFIEHKTVVCFPPLNWPTQQCRLFFSLNTFLLQTLFQSDVCCRLILILQNNYKS